MLHVQDSRIVLRINESRCTTNDGNRKEVQVQPRLYLNVLASWLIETTDRSNFFMYISIRKCLQVEHCNNEWTVVANNQHGIRRMKTARQPVVRFSFAAYSIACKCDAISLGNHRVNEAVVSLASPYEPHLLSCQPKKFVFSRTLPNR